MKKILIIIYVITVAFTIDSTYFETKNNGLISTCGYVENTCADDCFIDITITRIAKL